MQIHFMIYISFENACLRCELGQNMIITMLLRCPQPVWEQWWLSGLDGAVCVTALWASREQSADPACKLEESLQSGIDGNVGAHLSLSCIGAIPHRYYWFPAETSSITERVWPDEPGSIAEQRHSSLVMLYHQVNFRTSAYLKAVLFLNVIHIPLVALNEHFTVLLRALICLYWSL